MKILAALAFLWLSGMQGVSALSGECDGVVENFSVEFFIETDNPPQVGQEQVDFASAYIQVYNDLAEQSCGRIIMEEFTIMMDIDPPARKRKLRRGVPARATGQCSADGCSSRIPATFSRRRRRRLEQASEAKSPPLPTRKAGHRRVLAQEKRHDLTQEKRHDITQETSPASEISSSTRKWEVAYPKQDVASSRPRELVVDDMCLCPIAAGNDPSFEKPFENEFVLALNLALGVLGPVDSITETSDCFESVSHEVCQNFAVHARTTVTFAGAVTTICDGDVGVSPGTSVTGSYAFNHGQVVLDSVDFAASVLTAYTAAMEVGDDEKSLEIEIGGKTFTPGTYRSGSAITFTYGTEVTLDGMNDPNPKFLFIAGSTLVIAADTHFILKNGARAENVLWALGTAATLGANSVVEGSILAGSAVTFATRSVLHGCAIAQSAVIFESEGTVELNHYIDDGGDTAQDDLTPHLRG